MTETLEQMLGPRVPADEMTAHRARYMLPTVLFVIAALMLLASILLPYWRMTLNAPQYPKGLTVEAYVDRVEGDVGEIDGLNHYIGMRPLAEAAEFERSVSTIAIVVMGLLVVAAVFVHSRWAALLALPTLLYPLIFLGDLQYWLADFGRNLDPTAPLSSSVDPFVPPVLGTGVVAQFSTWARPGPGLWLAIGSSVIVAAGLIFHRRAYKPLTAEALAGGAAEAAR